MKMIVVCQRTQVHTSDGESEPELNAKMSKRKAANMRRKRG